MKNILRLTVVFSLCIFLSACQKELTDQIDTSVPSFVYDADALKFINSSGIIDSTQKQAINTLVKQLKDSSLWTTFMAIYPMVGGTAASTQWNLKDPENSDAAFRLTFNGAPASAGTGVLFPTIADYADTHLSDSMLTYNDNSISYYSETQNTVSGYDMGCYDGAKPYNEVAIYHENDASVWFGYYDFGPKPANTKGLFTFSATASGITRYENGAIKNSSNNPPVAGSTGYPILLGMVAGASSGGQRECSFAAIGSGLTATQALTFYNIVQNFERLLGR